MRTRKGFRKPTRRGFLRGLGVAVAASALPRARAVRADELEEDEKDDRPSSVAVFIDLAEKKRSDYSPATALPPDQQDFIVFGAVLASDIAPLRQLVRRTKKTLPAELRATKDIRAREATTSFKRTFYKGLRRLDRDVEEGFEAYEVFLDKALIPSRFKRAKGINEAGLYLALLTVLLRSADLSRFNKVYVHSNKLAIRNTSKRALRDVLSTTGVGPASRFEIHPTDWREHEGCQVADFVTWALLQNRQPHPLPNEDLRLTRVVRKFVRSETNAAGMI